MSEENEKNDPFDPLSDLSESEKYHVEQMMIDRAYENSYKLITKKTTFEDLMDAKPIRETKHEFRGILIYDPSEGWDDLHLEDMIDYFEETEEYEKCAELKKILDNYV